MRTKKKSWKVLSACMAFAFFSVATLYSATTVKDLRVEYLKNPVGIDVAQPRFSWKIESDARNIGQTAYEIIVSTDASGENVVWNSGEVVSDKSVHISYAGAALLPATRYYWKVGVRDGRSQKISSGEPAFFETGLMDSGWSGAQWLKAPLPPQNPQTHFTLEADMTVIKDNAGIIFSAADISHFYMWSFNTKDQSYPLLRRHYQNGGTWTGIEDVSLSGKFTKADLLNRECHIKIDVEGNVIKTYIDDVLVDDYTSSQAQPVPRGIGFRAYKGNPDVDEQAYWDNIVLTNRTNNANTVVFSENFESGNPFDAGQIEYVGGNAKFHMFSPNDDTRAFDDSMNGGIPMFRGKFGLAGEIRSARIYTSGLGNYEVFVNGKRIGTDAGNGKMIYDEFKPGWTDYTKTVFYSTYDVKDFLQQGNNVVGASVSSGWWKGGIAHGKYGDPALGFIAKLVVEYVDGNSEIVVTNPETWLTSSNGPVRAGDIYNGESYDARKESNWSSPGYDDSEWFQCALNTDFKGEIKAFTGPPVQVRPELQRTPVKITKYEGTTATGSTYGMINVKETYDAPHSIQLNRGQTVVYDMGQNMVGWVKFKVKGAFGNKMTLRFAEMLNDDGSASRGNDGPGGSVYRIALRSAKATLYYTLKGDSQGEEYHPSTSFFGFRYCEVTAMDNVEIESLTGEVVGTVAEEGSSFTTSHPVVNQLYSNIVWGQRCNFLSVPTDCPQRDERLGWTGDIQIFGRTASYNADLAGFFRKWMGDMRDGQRADGAFPDVAPHNWVDWGASAWADAGVIVPWNTYLMYNDKGILEENYEAMEKYLGFLAAQTGNSYSYNGAYDRYGDWVAYVPTDSRYISVCYYAYIALLMEKISKALSTGENDVYAQKAVSCRTLYDNIKTEFQRRYIASGRLRINTQTAYLLALKLDLFSTGEYRQAGIERLNQLFVNNGYKLNTGFVGTGTLNQTLSDIGLTDMAYNLLLQRNNPSWLYSVDQGATTIWERWNSYTRETGFNADISMNSFNHYAYGAVGEWMYRYMAGINPDENNPGFKHIILTPLPDFRKTRPAGQDRITRADASYNSYYGIIRSAWEITADNTVKYDFSVPANTTATVTLILSGDKDEVYESGTLVSEAEGVVSFRIEDKKAIIELQSGRYSFEVHNKGTAIKNMSTEDTHFQVYPNPVKDIVNFNTGEKILHIQVFNTGGMLVYSQRYDSPVNVRTFAPGVYFAKVDTGKNREMVKFIKD